MIKTLSIDQIRIDGGTQIRERFDEELLADLQRAYENKKIVEAPVVYFDQKDFWLADGYHRRHSALASQLLKLDCEVKPGSQRDARLYALTVANRKHGLRLSLAERRKRVEMLLKDTEWCEWSNRKMAGECGVSEEFVAKIRRNLPESTIHLAPPRGESHLPISVCEAPNPAESLEPKKRERVSFTNKYGKRSAMDVGKIGKKPASAAREEPALPEPAAATQIQPKRIDLLEALVIALRAYLAKPTQEVLRGLLDALGTLDEQADRGSQAVNGLEQEAP